MKKPIRRLLVVLLLGMFALCANGQETQEPQQIKPKPAGHPALMDKVFFGGGVNMWFSNSYSFIELSPIVGYKVTDRFSTGVGVTYEYVKQSYYDPYGREFSNSDNIWGGRVFAKYQVKGPLFLYGEYEDLRLQVYNRVADTFDRAWVPGMFLGGGLMQPLGRKGGVGIMLLYNVLYDDLRSPYNSPLVYRVSFFI